MGGRKSARVETVVGKSKKIAEKKKSFFKAVESKRPEKIISSSIGLFASSDQTIDNLYQATKLLDLIRDTKHEKAVNYQKRKEEVSKKWADIKKKEKLKTSSNIDRILVDSATKVIRRGPK